MTMSQQNYFHVVGAQAAAGQFREKSLPLDVVAGIDERHLVVAQWHETCAHEPNP
jgi:hypothetical protein